MIVTTVWPNAVGGAGRVLDQAATVLPLGVYIVLVLIALVFIKELTTNVREERARFLSRIVDLAIVPLSICLVAIVVVRVIGNVG